MTPDEFRRYGHQLVDWIADYREGLAKRPVLEKVEPGAIKAALPATPPEQPEAMQALIEDLDRLVMPGLTHWQHKMFFGYFPANALLAGVLADLSAPASA